MTHNSNCKEECVIVSFLFFYVERTWAHTSFRGFTSCYAADVTVAVTAGRHKNLMNPGAQSSIGALEHTGYSINLTIFTLTLRKLSASALPALLQQDTVTDIRAEQDTTPLTYDTQRPF